MRRTGGVQYARIILLGLVCMVSGSGLRGRPPDVPEQAAANAVSPQAPYTLAAGSLRHVGVHNAGNLYVPLSDGLISNGFALHVIDPETGEPISPVTYPRESGDRHVFVGALWVGGIVGEDTLVTVTRDATYFAQQEFLPVYPDSGGIRRTGQFADDEFETKLVDSASTEYPLDVEVRLRSYSWADSLYDDFVILDYTVTNVGDNDIRDGWAGFYFDDDIYHVTYYANGWMDDLSGALDTQLYAGDTANRVLIAYSCDNNGDPNASLQWHDASVQAVTGIMLLDCSFPVTGNNFNWWMVNTNPLLDYGPRRVGTPEDPLRLFSGDNLGNPIDDRDKYYMMSHPEIDFFQAETAVHDSSDGWIVPEESRAIDFADGSDTRFLYSFGDFDLPPGDSVRFVVALLGGDSLHTDPAGFANNFDPFDPVPYEEGLDFSGLINHARRADSVYWSGYYLPHPGAPAGLRITDYDDSYADLAWEPSGRSDLSGYRVYIKDTSIADIWRRVSPDTFIDTTLRIQLFEPTHAYAFAVSLADTLGRESLLSNPVTLIPGMPHPPENLTIWLDGALPVLEWQPSVDTALQAYLIYRSIWGHEFTLHDSTAALQYRDFSAESGVRYGYKVSAVNDLGFESEQSGQVRVMPMALDRGTLFHSLNRYETASGKLYPEKYVDELYESIASVTPVERIDVDDSIATLRTMSHYSTIVFEASNLPSAFWIIADSVRYYLSGGGRAVFAAPCLGRTGAVQQVRRYVPGDFYHDYLRLDSSVFPGVVLDGGSFVGDLVGCESLHPDYPPMAADPTKLTESDIPIIGDIPVSGYLFPQEDVELLYRYLSSNPDTASHGQINGFRYISEDYAVVVLNFPLMAMRGWENIDALRQALADIGVNMNCGDITNDDRIGFEDIIYLINYIYRDGPPPNDFWRADTSCDQVLDIADIVALINYIFRSGWLNCCPQ